MSKAAKNGAPAGIPRRWKYAAGVILVFGGLGGAFGLYGTCQNSKNTGYRDKAAALQDCAQRGFHSEKGLLRSQVIAKLRKDPTADMSEFLRQYRADVKANTDFYMQKEFDVAEDVAEFKDVLEKEQLALTVPLAERRLKDSQSDFAEYVVKMVEITANTLNPDTPACEKFQAVKSSYEKVVARAGEYASEGVEAPTFADLLQAINQRFDYNVALERNTRSASLFSDETLRKFVEGELAMDTRFAEQSTQLSDVYLERYKDLVEESIQCQTEKIMNETEQQRMEVLWQLGSRLEDAEINAAEVLKCD